MADNYLKPAPGRLVFRENGTEWPPEGESASTASKYVRRRIKDGDLVEEKAEKPAAEKQVAEKPAEPVAASTSDTADADKPPRKRS
jgi:hypothetical protein